MSPFLFNHRSKFLRGCPYQFLKFKLFYNKSSQMIPKALASQFDSAKIQQNTFYRFTHSPDEEYHNLNPILRTPLTETTNFSHKKQDDPVVNLEELWQSVERSAKPEEEAGKIKVSIMNLSEGGSEEEPPCEFTDEEFELMLAGTAEKEERAGEKPAKEEEQVEDLGDLWDQIGQQEEQITSNAPQKQSQAQPQPQPQPSSHPANEAVAQSDKFDLASLLNQKSERSLNYNLNKDYLVYDQQSFVMSCFETNIHSYFGFAESPNTPNHFYFYDLATREPIMECALDTYDQCFHKTANKKVKIDYEIEYCLKFRLSKSRQVVATAFHKYINNGILYNLKPYNQYEQQYEDSLALVQITDGFIGNNCYCNTNVYISQKYTNQPGQLKMIIGLKNGYLIANMGVNGVKSAPYNCRLENYQSNFVYLLGMIDKETSQFIVRVGEGMSPLIAFAISIGRKRYIDSFTQ